MTRRQTNHRRADERPAWDVFLVFLRLGLTSFGGPVAHLGYFREEFVTRRRWLDEASYADLIALCQFLPGPASSQVGMALGLFRAGFRGTFAAWLGFTLPSALIMMLFAYGAGAFGGGAAAGALHGLKVVAVAVVAQAVWGMARSLCPDAPRVTLMAAACCFVLAVPAALAQIAAIVIAAIVGLTWFTPPPAAGRQVMQLPFGRRLGAAFLIAFFVLLAGLPLLAWIAPDTEILQLGAFYRTGALVFGGGHVILPLLQNEVVATGWVDGGTFLAGYGMAQALPGPLTSFAAFLGMSLKQGFSGWSGGLVCLLAIFAPSFLLVAGALPFWQSLRASRHMQSALMGINAAVVGLLLAALYHPVWTSAILQPQDFGLAVAAFVALVFWRLPPWLVVIACGAGGWILA